MSFQENVKKRVFEFWKKT